MSELNLLVKSIAKNVGFELAGIASPEVPPETRYYTQWLNSGFGASMDYLKHRTFERLNPKELLPGLKSIIVCGLAYNTKSEKSIDMKDSTRGWISRYAWGTDYHFVVKKMLNRLIEQIQNEISQPLSYKCYVDTGPLLERVFAYRAGLGWFGKNSCLLNKKYGSYFFLGVILTDLEMAEDQTLPGFCGDCTFCIDACPTKAIVAPMLVDSRKCISYHTIENRDSIPDIIKDKIDRNIFGCDICQEVCPWNNKALLSEKDEFKPKEYFFQPELIELFRLIYEKYPESVRRSPLKRSKQRGLLRNLFITMGNSGSKKILSSINSAELRNIEDLREVNNWAISKLSQ